jgi:hypothetical protein
MASTETTAVIERLLEDDYVHEQFAAAGTGLRDAYRRARRLPPEKAAQDKTIYDRIRQTATGLIEAARRAAGKPKPEPPRRRRGPLMLVVLAAGAVVLWAAKNHNQAQTASEPPVAGSVGHAPTPSATPTATDR